MQGKPFSFDGNIFCGYIVLIMADYKRTFEVLILLLVSSLGFAAEQPALRPFREAQITSFLDGGSLCWNWKGLTSYGHIGERGRGFRIYVTKRRKPSWYTLESWDGPEAYALVKEGMDGNTSDTKVLIYNARLGQAFFIVFHYR